MNGFSQNLPLITSFLAGIATFVSPCVLPLIPAYISFITGTTLEELKEDRHPVADSVKNSLFFIAGFSLVFVLLGASASFIGGALRDYQDALRWVGGVVVILLGLHVAGVMPIKFLFHERRVRMREKSVGYAGSFMVGLAFAVGWTPCVGPILSSILILASAQETVGRGTMLLAAYSAGMAIPFLFTAVFMGWVLRFLSRIRRYYRYIEIASGVILVAAGILLVTDKFQMITGYASMLFIE